METSHAYTQTLWYAVNIVTQVMGIVKKKNV
jgi:hypothetical protein